MIRISLRKRIWTYLKDATKSRSHCFPSTRPNGEHRFERPQDFIPFVQAEFDELARAHGMREVYFNRLPALQRVIYANEDRMVSFALDLKDGYLSCHYGSASVLLSTGQPRWPDSENLSSLHALLKRDGIVILQGTEFEFKRVPEATRILIEGVRRHQGSVFGSDWDADGL